jgi:hypothetical protein
MMEAVRTSETSVYFYETTQRCIPQASYLHTSFCNNLKFDFLKVGLPL